MIRMNSLIRGHSGVRSVISLPFCLPNLDPFQRWELIEKMQELLAADIIPVVPLRGSISASGGTS